MKSKGKIVQLKFRQKNRDIFEAILNGRKKVETRAATEKFRDIKAGDVLILICGKEKNEKKVRAVRVFKSISALLGKYKVYQINPGVKTKVELIKMYHSFPGYREKIKKYGLIALEMQ